MKFGLASNEYVTGIEMNVDVKLVDRCQFGTMQDIRREYQILKTFESTCDGKQSCDFPIDLNNYFPTECIRDIADRISGKQEKLAYGPARLYAIIQCHYDTAGEATRSNEAHLVVLIDIIAVALFTLAIFRLKYYEYLLGIDMMHGQ